MAGQGFRAKKAGLALHLQKAQEAKYDQEEKLGTPERVMEWMNAVLQGQHDSCSKSSWRHFHYWMRDGVALCKLINKLRQADGMSPIKFSNKNVLTAFIAMENIQSFNKAAGEYGLADTDLFQSVDLYEGSKATFLNVINCLNKLGFAANRKGFNPKYEAIEPPKLENDTT